MRTVLQSIFTIALFVLPVCSYNTSSAISTAERCLVTTACIGVTYGIGRVGAWVRIWDTKRNFAQEIDLISHFYGSQEELKQLVQDIILIRHSGEYTSGLYHVYPLLWYKNILDSYLVSLKFWRIATLGSSDWGTIHKLIDQLTHVRNLVVTNYLYIGELRSFANEQQRYCYV